MSLADDIRAEVRDIYREQWETRDGRTVPDTEDIALGNVAVKLKGTVLYADLADSTTMVNTKKPGFAAEVYKAYLTTACRIIRDQGGEITAFDGDRVMAVFTGDIKDTAAAKTALKINWAVENIVNTELKNQYKESTFKVRQTVGIDTGDLWVARTGIRGANDLVWVGRAANYAAKLCSLGSTGTPSWITETVYNAMDRSAKYGSDGRPMWEKRTWTAYNCFVYCSNWWWPLG
ncbi:MAG TPA: adenylate/guanylate cyclase domain-containing protein [Kiritimatiellia bacterium]|nr:adenylate/guanylate cyclase domain-containing protein [Kiritimatiellia bacterium]